MTEADARILALAMQFGSLPVASRQLTTQTVSPPSASRPSRPGWAPASPV